jgi:NAD(P)-dependent dehydrogenase (short-subunit alcohol dehydrogenase family)
MGTIVITGAGSGIGLATARWFLERGHRVVAGVRTAASAAATRDALRNPDALDVRVADVRDDGAVAGLFADPVDAVVAAAGICRQARLDEPESDRVWAETLATNVNGVYAALKHGTRAMAPGGSVVVVSSNLGKNARAAYGAYTASKHAVLGLARAAALELAPREIRVNAVCPGWVDTPMARRDCQTSAHRAGESVDDLRARALAGIPLGRMIEPGEVAALIGWLTGDEARAITGQAYNIAGGEFLN